MAAPGKDADKAPSNSLQGVAGHPIKSRIIAELTREGSGSAADIAQRIDVPVRSVRHQLTRLAAEQLVEVSASRHRRGALEKIYRVSSLVRLESTAFEEMSPVEARRITGELLRSIVDDVTGALVAGTFDRPGSSGIRIEMEVDEEGWVEIADVMGRIVEEIEGSRGRVAKRLEQGHGDPRQSMAVLLWFERPPSGDLDGPAAALRTASGPPPDLESVLAEAIAHPIKAKIVIALAASRPLGVVQIAERIREPAHRVRYHLGGLLSDGLVERTRSSGRTRHRYALVVTPVFDDDEMAKLTTGEARHFWGEIFRRIVIEAAEAISAGTFFRRPEFYECRIPVAVDQEGWLEIAEISRRASETIDTARSDAGRRLSTTGSEPMIATAAILWLELPPA